MKKIVLFFIVNCLLFIANCLAQPSITWNRLYNGGFYDNDYGYGLCQTTDGNFVIGGRTRYHGALTLKINAYGDVIWLKHYSVTYGEAITATNDGGCLLVSPSFLKINSSGDSIWYKNYSSYGVTNLYDVIQCSDDGYFTCGRAYYDSGYVMKTDEYGNMQWQKLLSDSSLIVRLYVSCEADSGGYIVAGEEFSLNETYSVFAKYNSNGQRLWIKKFDINNINSIGYGTRIVHLPPYYFIACSRGYIKMDEEGNIMTSKLIALGYSESMFDMKIISDNKFVLVSQTYIMPALTSSLHIIDSSGNMLASRNLNFSDFVRMKKIQLVENGDIVFTGDAARYDTSDSDIYAVRTDENLNYPPIKIQNISGNIPNDFRLCQNYPNPFNPFTKITYELPVTVYVKLAVYDILGREIDVLVNKNQLAGKYELIWNAYNYPSGIYFYKITAVSAQYQLNSILYSETKKMILIK